MKRNLNEAKLTCSENTKRSVMREKGRNRNNEQDSDSQVIMAKVLSK